MFWFLEFLLKQIVYTCFQCFSLFCKMTCVRPCQLIKILRSRTVNNHILSPLNFHNQRINDLCKSCLSIRSEEHTSELQSRGHLVCRLLLEKKNKMKQMIVKL